MENIYKATNGQLIWASESILAESPKDNEENTEDLPKGLKSVLSG